MAASILKGLHFPRLVARVEVHPGDLKVVRADNCEAKFKGLFADDAGCLWLQKDRALPFFPEDAKSILELSEAIFTPLCGQRL